MKPRDVAELRLRLEGLHKAATVLSTHAHDLYSLGWERTVSATERVAGGEPDHSPQGGDPRAQWLFRRVCDRVERAEAEFTGLSRAMVGLFVAHAPTPDESRGSIVSVAEFTRLQIRQQRRQADGEYTPARLMPQPKHPGRK